MYYICGDISKQLTSTNLIMKKKTLTTLGLIALLAGSGLQARTLGWGLTGGINVTKMNLDNNWEDMTKPESEKGWYAGVTGMASIPVVGIGIDGSIVYSQEEVQVSQDSESETAQYISLPVHLRYDFRMPLVEDWFVPYLMIGPQFNYALNDVKFAIDEGTSTEALLKKANSWRLDMGVGMILFNHLQLTYSYGIPVGPSAKLMDETAQEIVNKCKMGSHRMGLAIYF